MNFPLAMFQPRTAIQKIQTDAEQAARRFRLPFSSRAWSGVQGNWTGNGAGSSIDFQGHRSYQWGDDPRDIHWAAYARTGQLTMKVFQAELSPRVDVAVDVSESMFFHENRAARTQELLQFCLLSAARTGGLLQIHAVKGRRFLPLETEEILSGQWLRRIRDLPPDEMMPVIPVWRPNGMKILLTDLLYPGEPDSLLAAMTAHKGLSIILAPTLPEEAELPSAGNVKLKNCESGRVRRQLVTPALAKRYARAYAAHFELWASACLRHQAVLARVPCTGSLTEALSGEAFAQGAVELA